MTKIYLYYGEMNILDIFYTCYEYYFLRVLLVRLNLFLDMETINSINVRVMTKIYLYYREMNI